MHPTSENEAWEKLIEELKEGAAPEEPFRRIFQVHYRPVLDFFRHRGFSPEESRDLAQETFLNIFRGIRDFRGESSLGTWVARIAAHIWHNELRRRSTAMRAAAQEVALDDLAPGMEPSSDRELPFEWGNRPRSPLLEVLESERMRILHDAFGSLPPQMRRCIQLRVAQDLKYHEIAAAMQLSIQTVRSHLHEARQRLRAKLEPYFYE